MKKMKMKMKINNITCSGLKTAIKLIGKTNTRISTSLIINSLTRCLYQNNSKKKFDIFEKKHLIIQKWFNLNMPNEIKIALSELIMNRNLIKNAGSTSTLPIWILWWQGQKKMPEVAKECYKSLLLNAGDHPVILITENNIKQYLQLPEHLFERFKQGKVPIQKISDIIRLYLLHYYGGLWIDCTMFLAQPLNDAIFNKDFFSLKQQNRDNLYVSRYRWDGSFMAARQGNVYTKFIGNIHLTYSLKFDFIIDYFIIDSIIDLLCTLDEDFNTIINHLPYSNPDTSTLSEQMNDEYDKTNMDKLLVNNIVFKLNHRVKYKEYTNDGKLTYWGYFKQLNANNS